MSDSFAHRMERLRARLLKRAGKAPTRSAIDAFRSLVLDHYRAEGRDLPWRHTTDPYRVLVSEIMLQQTQVPRVIAKYAEFLEAFPDIRALAAAPVDVLLRVWQGLGYNRRALLLQRTAQAVVEEHRGVFPRTFEELTALPGIGPATAADLLAFAFNTPAVVVETNIRAVYIHMFFTEGTEVHDRDLVPLIDVTMDRNGPCRWFNALMDFGVLVKKLHGNPARRSAHHARQSKFEGSNRQVRSRILKYLLSGGPATRAEISDHLGGDQRVDANLESLVREGMLEKSGRTYSVRS